MNFKPKSFGFTLHLNSKIIVQTGTFLRVKGMLLRIVSVQFSCSVMSGSLRPHESQHARPPCPSPTPGVHSHTSIESVMPSSHLILCRSLLLLPPIPPSIRVFSNESALRMRWPKYWSFSFSTGLKKKCFYVEGTQIHFH